ncbi:MAG: putative glycosyltransferase EpsF [Candidatus Dependentiae bacterium ADurb.Bin331]|nr:MAG: putative glycosyltransferase EpsF [Candidatus Dependentiae bacterium ADurb.Bin331]
MQTIKVMHVISSLKTGGAETLLCDLVAQLHKKNIQQAVVFIHPGPKVEALRSLSIPLYHLRGAVCLFDPLFFVRFYRMVKKEKPTCIHSSLWAANVVARIIGIFTRTPVICVLHNNNDQNGFVRNAIDMLSLWLADELIAVSEGVVRTMRTYRFLPAERVKVIRNGIDAVQVRARAQEQIISHEQLGFLPTHFIIGAVGRFVALKNYSFLLTVFARIYRDFPSARLILVGGGPEESRLRAQAVRLGIKNAVCFVIGQKAYGYYRLFDCFVQSSTKEGISIALLEAMSFGRACVVTTSERDHEVIENGKNGYIVAANDEDALYEALKIMIEKPFIRKKCENAAHITIESNFTLAKMVGEYENLYYFSSIRRL